ncbi:hypothetical protein IAU59_005453 [Kwoniella sp. CBS 9459]
MVQQSSPPSLSLHSLSLSEPISPLALDRFPSDLSAILLEHIANESDRPTLATLMRCSRSMFRICGKALYKRLDLCEDNVSKVFNGIDWDNNSFIVEENYPDDKSFASRLKQIADPSEAAHERKVWLLKHVETLILGDFPAAEALVDATGFNNKSLTLSLPLYKSSFRHDAAESNVVHGEDEDDEDDRDRDSDGDSVSSEASEHQKLIIPGARMFSHVRYVCFGRDFLESDSFYPHCAHNDIFPAHPVTKILQMLLASTEHICQDWRASLKFHPEDENFTVAIEHLLQGWSGLKSYTRHHIGAEPPFTSYGAPIHRFFFEECPGSGHTHTLVRKAINSNLSYLRTTVAASERDAIDYGCHMLHWRMGSVLDSDYWCCDHERKEREDSTMIEMIHSSCGTEPTFDQIAQAVIHSMTGTLSADDILSSSQKSTRIASVKKRWAERKEWSKTNLTITRREDAEPCVCCGGK